MSKLQLSPNPSGAGIVTLAAPNTASDVTLTLPAVTAELITNSSGVLNIGAGQIYKNASGNVGIGTSSPTSYLHVASRTAGDSSTITVSNDGTTTGTPQLLLSRSATDYSFVRHAPGGASTSLRLLAVHPVSPGITFSTSLDGSTINEHVRINASGNLLVGTTSGTAKVNINNTGSGGSYVTQSSAGGYNFVSNALPLSSVYYHIQFLQSGTPVGSILSSGSSTSYNTSSDYRLKENVAPMTGALQTVAALKPVTYTWKADGSDGQGFIAHELQAVVPDCVTGEKDAVDKDGNPQYQGVDTSFLVATLVSAIQELTARLEVLENK
jgi:hypothetical protein